MRRRKFDAVKIMDKGQWRRKAQEAWAKLTADEQQSLRIRLGYPLRIKDFNERMCKRVISMAKEIRNETNRNLNDSGEGRT